MASDRVACGRASTNTLIAAWAVVFTHSYFLASASDTPDPLPLVLGGTHGFGDYAVQVFFILSGFLLSGSLDLNLDPLRYLANRLFRVVPGFCFAVLASVLVIAPCLADLGWRLPASSEAWSSIGWSILMLKDVVGFHMGQVRHAEFAWFLNGSLWSIPYEMVCYLGPGTVRVVRPSGDSRGCRLTALPQMTGQASG